MLALSSLMLLGGGAMVTSCREEVVHLEPVQKMAYRVKPAVVRVNAYATARFQYDREAIHLVGQRLAEQGLQPDPARVLESGFVATGAGGSGSGFVIHPAGLILTNAHVVAPTRDREAIGDQLRTHGAVGVLMELVPVDALRALSRKGALEPIVEELASRGSLADLSFHDTVELSNGDRVPFTVERYSPPLAEQGRDLALLEIDRTNLPTLALADSDRVLLQDSIWIIGYPSMASTGDDVIGGWLSRETDLEATINPGTITAIRRDRSNAPVLQTDAAIYPGNSGGPAVNRDGEVIGIPTWGHGDATQIRFLVPGNVARQFLGAAGIPLNIEGEFNREYRRALDRAGRGDWLLARRHLLKADSLFSQSPDLARFLREADRAIQSEPAWRRRPRVAAAIGIGLVLLGVGGLAFRSGPRHPVPPAQELEMIIVPAPRGTIEGASADEIPSILGRFTILNGEKAGQRLSLGGSGIRIGRESSICEIVLENPKISRLHAEVVRMEGEVLLIDRNSSNGTYVNDKKIERASLRNGDIIYFGGRNAVAVAFHA